MKSTSSSATGHVAEQASLWAARLEGSDLTESQCAELDAWLVADPAHREALASYCQISSDLESLLPELVATGRVTMPEMAAAKAAAPSHHWGWLGAGLAAAAALAFIFTTSTPSSPGVERIATAIAECQSITLSDGTAVELNAHTNLVFNATTTERRVRMGGGQAFFAVTKDPHRPFIVDTPLGSVRVTGTAFDVRTLSAENIAVTVAEGSVEVRLGENNNQSATAPIRLEARDQLSVVAGESNVRQLSEKSFANELAWRDGLIIVDAATLGEVLERFAHYHGLGISASPEVTAYTLSGRFPVEDLDGFLLGLESIHPVRVIRDQSGTIRIISRD